MDSVPVHLSLVVNDAQKAVEFYCKTLKLFEEKGPPGTLRFRGEPGSGLVVVQAYGDDMASVVGKQSGDFPLMAIPVRDCAEMYSVLKAAGVRFQPPTGAATWGGDDIYRLPYGEQLICFDPFGNRICLFQHYIHHED